MKKIVSLLLCVAILCSMVVVVAHADGGAAAQFADATTIPGGSVTIDMVLANNPGVIGLRFTIIPQDEIGATFTFDGISVSEDLEMAFPNNEGRIYAWDALTNCDDELVGALTITVPSETPAGSYKFTVVGDDCKNGSNQVVPIAGDEFTITVANKVITGVNVAIDASLAIGIHVATEDPDNASITAVDIDNKEFITIIGYEEDEENGGYIYYLNVNPWDMDREFTFDFTDNFSIDEETDELDLAAIPDTARTIGILSYCEAVKGTSKELDQLIADMLEYGRQAQIYNGADEPSYDLPNGLTATSSVWEIADPDSEDPEDPVMIEGTFAEFCAENYVESIAEWSSGNTTAKNGQKAARKRFKFSSATIEIGAKFVVKFDLDNNGTEVGKDCAVIVVGDEEITYDPLDDDLFVYAFNPMQYEEAEFELYGLATSSTARSNSNKAWVNTYSPAHYAGYIAQFALDEESEQKDDAQAILTILEAYYNYGVSVAAYVGE